MAEATSIVIPPSIVAKQRAEGLCRSCRWCLKSMQDDTWDCRIDPPQVTVIITVQQDIVSRQPKQVPVTFTSFPLVDPKQDYGCSKWQPKATR